MKPVERVRAFARAHSEVLAVFAAALAVRLVYGLFVHPPGDHLRSDMAGYVDRAQRALDTPDARDPWMTFFPYGTHGIVAAVQAVFGRGNAPLGIAFALMGALAVAYSHAIAQRLLPDRRRLRVVFAAFVVLAIPHVMLGGFVLSEVPFSLTLAALTFYLLRHFDEGRWRDAAFAGLAFAAALTIRPQVLISLPFFALAYARAGSARLDVRAITAVLAPLVIVGTLSAVRVHHHVGRYGFVSTNGAFNFAIGRCHCQSLSAQKTRGSRFEVGAFRQLAKLEDNPSAIHVLPLDAARGRELAVDSELWDERASRELALSCMKETGPLRQLRYSATHLVLLFAANLPFPTKGVGANIGAGLALLLVPGAFVGLFRSLSRERARLAIVSANVLALFVTAFVFFGEARMRVPYDAFFALLALPVYAEWTARLRRRRKT